MCAPYQMPWLLSVNCEFALLSANCNRLLLSTSEKRAEWTFLFLSVCHLPEIIRWYVSFLTFGFCQPPFFIATQVRKTKYPNLLVLHKTEFLIISCLKCINSVEGLKKESHKKKKTKLEFRNVATSYPVIVCQREFCIYKCVRTYLSHYVTAWSVIAAQSTKNRAKTKSKTEGSEEFCMGRNKASSEVSSKESATSVRFSAHTKCLLLSHQAALDKPKNFQQGFHVENLLS